MGGGTRPKDSVKDRVTLGRTGTNFNSSHAGNVGCRAELNGSAIAHVFS